MTASDGLLKRTVRPASGHPGAMSVLLHGRGDDETALAVARNEFPDGVEVVALRAPTPDGDADSDATDGEGAEYRWYDTVLPAGSHDRSQPRPGEFRDALDAVHATVDAVVGAQEDVGLFGYSQGAMVALAALVERPERYDWTVALHGYLPASHGAPALAARTAGTPVFVGYGEADAVIPPWRSERAAAHLRAGGADVTVRPHSGDHDLLADLQRRAVEWAADRP